MFGPKRAEVAGTEVILVVRSLNMLPDIVRVVTSRGMR
jgi:hypothetical protein